MSGAQVALSLRPWSGRLGRRVVGLFIGVAASSPFSVPMSRAMRTLVALGVVNTGAGFWLFYTLIAEAAARRASVITYVMPAVAVFSLTCVREYGGRACDRSNR